MKRPFPLHSNVVWPPTLLVVLFAVLYGLVVICLWLTELAVPNTTGTITNLPEIAKFRAAILAGAAAVYAAYRLWRFHPACNPAYAAWLRLSPWSADRPLPVGPIHWVWQDAAVLGVLAAIAAWNAHADPWLPVMVFVLVYLVGMTLLLVATHRWWSCFILGFLWPALVLPGVVGWPGWIILAAIIAVIWPGHRQSLKAFPWEFRKKPTRRPHSPLQTEVRIAGLNDASAAGTQYNLGWPVLALSPKVQPVSISPRTNLALALLVGWWSFCAIERLKINPLPELIVLFAIVAAIIRVGIYCAGVMPPFNVWGRLATGRIVVPGFDRVFLTPIAVVLTGILGGIIIKRSGTWYPVAESCVMAVIWYVLFGGGPTLRNWALTGQHRVRPPARLNANKQMMRSA